MMLRLSNPDPESPPDSPKTGEEPLHSTLLADDAAAGTSEAAAAAAAAAARLDSDQLQQQLSNGDFSRPSSRGAAFKRQSSSLNAAMVSSFITNASVGGPDGASPIEAALSAQPSEDASISALEAMSDQELKWRLKEALAVIKEKERDLIIAAEIGQQLVSVNNSIAAEYEELKARQGIAKQVGTRSQSEGSGTPEDSKNSADAFRALKRASTSLTKSRLGMLDVVDRSSLEDPSTLPRQPGARRPSDPDTRKLNRKSSSGIYEYVTDLERTNADLREQLGTAIANLQDAEKIHSRTLANLRKTNASLQDQLHSALQDVRNTEQAHNRTISALEADLESLRSELSNASIAQFELENEKKRLAREKVDAIRESQSVESADTRVIYDLQKRIRALEDANAAALASKKDAERKLKQAREDLEEAKSLAAELQERVESAVGLREECERRGALIMELKEQLEDSRTSAIDSNEAKMFQNATTVVKRPTGPANSELSVVLQKGDQEWSWSPWLMSVREKVWERDINGLRDEIADLTQHREAAYVRLRSGIDEMLGIFVQALPTPVQAITTRVIGVLSPPMAAAGLPASTIAASPETKKLIAAAAEPTDAAAPAPEEKDVPSNAVSEAATPGPVA